MKKTILFLSSLIITTVMYGQVIPQPQPGELPVIKIGKPKTFQLENGLQVMVVENHKLPRVSISLSLDTPLYAEGNKKGVSDLVGSLLGNGTKNISKTDYIEELDFLGAKIEFSPNGVSAMALSKNTERVLQLLADGILNPNFIQEELEKERTKHIENLIAEEKSVPAIANRVRNSLAFGKDHPLGEFVSENTLKNITLSDVQENYNTYFVPNNAYLVIVGNIKFGVAKKIIEKSFESWKMASLPIPKITKPKNVSFSRINFVDVPNAVQSDISVINLVNLKMTDPDYFAALIANEILGGGFNSYLNMNLREKHAWTYGARSKISGDKNVSKFLISTQVRNKVTDSTVVEILKEYRKIRTHKVSEELLASVKAGYIGRFIMQIEKPQTIADCAFKMSTQNLPANYYEDYIQNINAVTAEDVLKAANKYFLENNSRILIVGKGNEVVKSLEKLKIPMFFFDKYATTVDKFTPKKENFADVTVKTVLDKYIESIGGEKNVKTVATIYMKGSTTIPQAPFPLSFTSKTNKDGKLMVELAMGETKVMRQVLSDSEGYVMQQGQRFNLSVKDIKNMRASAVPFEELYLSEKEGLILDGIEKINGMEAYAIKKDKTTLYYDVKSGLKVSEVKTLELNGKTISQTTNYSDYRLVSGVKVPFAIYQNSGIEMNIIMSDIKINEGVSDSDFK